MKSGNDRIDLSTAIAILKEWIEELEHGAGSHRKLSPTGKLAIDDLKARLLTKQALLYRSHQATMRRRSAR